MTWQDLSDSELRARLMQRGINPEIARMMTAHRDGTHCDVCVPQIDKALAR